LAEQFQKFLSLQPQTISVSSFIGQLPYSSLGMSPSEWVLDSGVSHHMSPNSLSFTSVSSLSFISIMTADDICHHPILGDSPKFIFFQKTKKKIKIKNKGWQCGESRPRKAAKIDENQAAIFRGISRPNCTLLCPKIEKCKFKGQIK